LQVLGGLVLSDSQKAEALADSLEAEFQSVEDPSDPSVIEMVSEALGAYECALASEPTSTRPTKIVQALKGLKFGKAPVPNDMLNRVVRHLPKRKISFLTKVTNAVFRRQHFPPAWKHAVMVFMLKLGKYLTLTSSYRPKSPPDTIGKFFEKALRTRVLREVKERGLLRDEQFGVRPRHSTTLQLACLVTRVSRNFDRRRLTGADLLNVSKAFDTAWVRGLPDKLTLSKLPVLPGENYIVIL
jgi:hypothetical protein